MFIASFKSIAVYALLTTFVVSKAFAADFADAVHSRFKLKTLSTPTATTANKTDNTDKVAIAMVYQPDCKWCKKQGKWLAKAQSQCQNSIDIILLGNNGKRQQLKTELKHFHQDISAYQANRKLLTAIGGVEASPTTLVFDQQGELLVKRRGFINDKQLTDVAKIISQGKCVIQ